MSKDTSGKAGEYEVGFRKPPKAYQYVPGQSGFKGHRRKRDESKAEIVARVRDQEVTVGGRTMTMFELAISSVMTQTMKGGKTKDLKVLFEMFDKYGAIPDHDRYAEMKAHADEAMLKISQVVARMLDIDEEAKHAIEQVEDQEVDLVLRCAHCGPQMRRGWRDPDYRQNARRSGPSCIHKLVTDSRERRRKKRRS